MRVLALTNLYPNPRQPHRASFNRRQFAALAERHEVRVIAPVAWTAGLSPGRMPRVSDGMIVHHPRYVFTPKVLRGWYGHFYMRSVRACFERAVEELKPDVVLGSWAYPDGWAAVRLAREAGVPVVVKVHGSDVLTLPRGSRWRRTVEALTGADAVVAVSRHLRDAVIAMGVDPARAHVVYNGIDTRLFCPGPRGAGGEPLVLFVGNLVAVKGLDVLIEALALLTRDGVAYRCACIGQGPLRGRLESQVRARGLAERVRFVGACRQEELPEWYRRAHVVVLPSRSEGVPNVLLEAAACGTPCVASGVGGIPEIVSGAALVPPENPAALAERLGAFLSERRGSTSVYTPGSWSESAGDLASVLRGVASSRLRVAA